MCIRDSLYIADTLDNTFQIIRADGSLMTQTAELSMTQKMDSIYEFYVTGDTLTIIGASSQASLEQNTSDDVYRTVLSNQTVAVTYDIRDRSMPSEIGSVTQDGYYETSRRNGNYLYLFTNYYKDELPALSLIHIWCLSPISLRQPKQPNARISISTPMIPDSTLLTI